MGCKCKSGTGRSGTRLAARNFGGSLKVAATKIPQQPQQMGMAPVMSASGLNAERRVVEKKT